MLLRASELDIFIFFSYFHFIVALPPAAPRCAADYAQLLMHMRSALLLALRTAACCASCAPLYYYAAFFTISCARCAYYFWRELRAILLLMPFHFSRYYARDVPL